MSDMVISDMADYRRGKAVGAADCAAGASYVVAYPADRSVSFIAGWMTGWDRVKTSL